MDQATEITETPTKYFVSKPGGFFYKVEGGEPFTWYELSWHPTLPSLAFDCDRFNVIEPSELVLNGVSL